jgi:hypothetical protein
MHALIAASSSILLGLLTVHPGDYRYWHHWVPRTFAVAGLGLILSYGLAGVAGFAVIGAVEPDGASASAAAVEGLAGHAVLRARIDTGDVEPEPAGVSLFGLVRRWLLQWLHGQARVAIRTRLAGLSDEELVELAFDIFWENTYNADPGSGAVGAAVAQHEMLRSAGVRLTGAEAPDARASIRGFCLGEIQRHRLILVAST